MWLIKILMKKTKAIAKENSVKKSPKVELPKVLVRCPACPWKPGMKNEHTLCNECNGTGQVLAVPLQ